MGLHYNVCPVYLSTSSCLVLIFDHQVHLQIWLLGVYVLHPGDCIFVPQFQFYVEILNCNIKNVLQSTRGDMLICLLLFVLTFLKRLVLLGNKSLDVLLILLSKPGKFFYLPFHARKSGKFREFTLGKVLQILLMCSGIFFLSTQLCK